MKPEDVGWTGTGLVIGKHSGKHAVETVLKDMGYELSKKQVDQIMLKIKELADKQKEVVREDIIAIANDVIGTLSEEEQNVVLDEVKVETGNKTTPTATVTLIINGKKQTGKGEGVGPVDAVSHAVSNIIGPEVTLKEYNLKAITGGTNALADVIIKIEDKKGHIFSAEAVNEDVIMASAEALIKGINKALAFKKQKEKQESL
jgi:hypothetical protein